MLVCCISTWHGVSMFISSLCTAPAATTTVNFLFSAVDDGGGAKRQLKTEGQRTTYFPPHFFFLLRLPFNSLLLLRVLSFLTYLQSDSRHPAGPPRGSTTPPMSDVCSTSLFFFKDIPRLVGTRVLLIRIQRCAIIARSYLKVILLLTFIILN